jgi:CRP/FNR family transcriptional regulator, nitrogen oxide reductase regulator
MEPCDDLTFLAGTRLFAGLEEAGLRAAQAAARPRAWARGAVLFHQGAPPEQLHLLRSGRVKVSRVDAGGAPLTVRFLEAGEIIGCVAVFRQVPYPATAIAATPVAGLTWPAAAVAGLLQRFPRVATNALEIVGGRTEELLRRLQEMAREPVETRIARVLLRLSAQSGRPTAEGTELGFDLSRQDIAELAGTDLYGVSRTLSRWAREGILGTRHRRIVIRDPARLAARAS